MNIVVLDGYTLNPGDLSWEKFNELGSLKVFDRTSSEDVISRIGDAEYVLTNKTVLGKNEFENCPNLKYIGVLATGYNVVDIESASNYGITVTNIPSYGTKAVSQYVFALLLELCHHVGHHSKRVSSGAWEKSIDFCFWDFPSMELFGKTIGIIGMGKIGHATSEIAKGFGMKVIAFSPHINKQYQDEGIEYVTFDQLLSQSDVISLHCPLFKETIKMINSKTINKMKDGVILINTSRGQLIDEDDLYNALVTKKISGAALDVLSEEPPCHPNKLVTLENCIITPHIAWSAKESRTRLMSIAFENLNSYISGKIINSVNKK